ncbi:uncharacterized protein LOC120708160 [Panicum virgatum]|uniref:uncharacterized protein LOC120708160 n=1 Tax=Panicum virgatum TaxID=38727 RepID=UPI0019D5345F|nr:uncharacterized protein LOC120708160 [Panicum virgatum]
MSQAGGEPSGNGNIFAGSVTLDIGIGPIIRQAGDGQLVSGAGGEEALRGGLGEAARGGRRDARPALHPGHGGAGAQGDTANHGGGEAIGGHGVHGHGNVFMDGGGRVTITMGPLERIAAARQGGGHAQRGGRREVRRGVQHLHGDAGPVRGQARGVHPFHGDGGPRAGHLVPHRAAPAVAAVADRERMDAKLQSMIRPVVGCLVVAIVGFLGACITLAPSNGFKTASIVLLVTFACVAPICLLMIFAHHDSPSTGRDFSAALFISFFLWLFVSIGMFMESSLLHLHKAVPSCLIPLLTSVVLCYWGRNFTHPTCLSNLMRCCSVVEPPPRQEEEKVEEEEELPEREDEEREHAEGERHPDDDDHQDEHSEAAGYDHQGEGDHHDHEGL